MSGKPIQKKTQKIQKIKNNVKKLHENNQQKTDSLRKVLEQLQSNDTECNEFRLLALSMLSSTLDRVELQSLVMKLESRLVHMENEIMELRKSETQWKKYAERLYLEENVFRLHEKEISQFVDFCNANDPKPETVAAALPVLYQRNKKIKNDATKEMFETIYPQIQSGQLAVTIPSDIRETAESPEVFPTPEEIPEINSEDVPCVEFEPFKDLQSWIEGFDWKIWASGNLRKNVD